MNNLKKDITLISGIGQLSTTLLGTGIFMIPAISAGIAGHYSLWAWVILLIAVCPIALTFAQLGKRYPSAGGTAFFVRKAFNNELESSVAWLFVSVIPVALPAGVTLASGFLNELLPESMNIPLFTQAFVVILLMLVNLLGTKLSGRLQTVIALSIFALVGAFLWKGDVGPADLTMPAIAIDSTWSIATALGVMFWCFVGIEAFAHMGEEFKNPQRDFPIAIIVGCFVAGLTYWACSVVILKFGAYGSAEFDNASIPWLSAHLFGDHAKWLISVIGFSACFASVNLYTQSLARMVWAQAREHIPTSAIARVSVRGVPANATLIVGAILLASCVMGSLSGLDLEFFLKLANGIFVLVYLLAMLAAYKLLKGWGKVLAGFSLVLCTAVFMCLGWSMLYAVTIFAVLSLPWKQWRKKNTRRLTE